MSIHINPRAKKASATILKGLGTAAVILAAASIEADRQQNPPVDPSLQLASDIGSLSKEQISNVAEAWRKVNGSSMYGDSLFLTYSRSYVTAADLLAIASNGTKDEVKNLRLAMAVVVGA